MHRYRNVLWKYLGSAEVGEGPEVKVVQLQAGDRFLLCTDGLSGVGHEEEPQRAPHQCSLFGATSIRAPAEFPRTAPSYIISAELGGCVKLPATVARVRK